MTAIAACSSRVRPTTDSACHRRQEFTPVYERVSHDPAWQIFCLPVGHNVIAEAFDPLLEITLRFTS